MHVPRFAADEGFVHLDFASEHSTGEVILHGKPNPVEHEPSSFLGDAKCPM
jgi:hypothetical protein